jgi:hypothetical protein
MLSIGKLQKVRPNHGLNEFSVFFRMFLFLLNEQNLPYSKNQRLKKNEETNSRKYAVFQLRRFLKHRGPHCLGSESCRSQDSQGCVALF